MLADEDDGGVESSFERASGQHEARGGLYRLTLAHSSCVQLCTASSDSERDAPLSSSNVNLVPLARTR